MPKAFQKKSYLLIILVSSLTLIAAILFLRHYLAPKEAWVSPKEGPIVESVYGLGTVTPERELKLKPGVASTIQKIFVKEGDRVQTGAPLIKLSELPVMKAPFEGTVTDLPFKEGENIFPQIPILTLMDLKNLYLTLLIEQTSAIQVRASQKVSLAFESMRGQRFEGVVQSITPKEGQFAVRVQVDHLPDGILPGMTADCAIAVAKKEHATLIPLKSIKNGKIQFRKSGEEKNLQTALVKVGVVDGEWAELVEPKFDDPHAIEIKVIQNRKP